MCGEYGGGGCSEYILIICAALISVVSMVVLYVLINVGRVAKRTVWCVL